MINIKIKQLRESRNLTQRELSEKIFVSRSVVAYYESGKRVPPYDVIKRLCECFQVDYNTLMSVSRLS
jgi:transcriptional regulator with XRE-family HTH domain